MSRLLRGLLLALTTTVGACDSRPQLEVRTFFLEHISGFDAGALIDAYVYGHREGAPGAMSAVENAITVRETSDNLDQIARVLEEYDVERPDVLLRFQLIEADGFTDTDSRIADVAAELRRVFRFEGYRLAGEAVVSASDASNIQQSLRAMEVGNPASALSISAHVRWVSATTIRLEEVTLTGVGPTPLLETTVNVRPGQTLVLGTSPQPGGATWLLTVRVEEG